MTCDRHHGEDGKPATKAAPTDLIWCPQTREWMTRQAHQERFAPPEGWS